MLVRSLAERAVLLTAFPLVLFLTPPTHGADIIKNSDCMECHNDKTLASTNAAGKVKALFVDERKLAASAHKTNLCVACHSDLTRKHPDDNLAAKPVNCATCHERQSESYGASVHGLAARAGKQNSASCQDCHDSHEVLPPTSPNSPLHFNNLARTCGGCHDQAAKDIATSVHGKSIAAGHREAASCIDCHSEHKIEALTGADTSLKISKDVCSKCHSSEKINTKFRMPKDRVKTFFESYHGLASQYGSTLAANCGSCHGFHKILPSTDPRSTIHTNNLVATCGKCHPGATEKFALSTIHVDISSAKSSGGFGDRLNWWVRKIYLLLIFGVIGFMLAHNGLLMFRKLHAAFSKRHRPVQRMDRSQRLQHAVLAASFIVLAITGFALKYPESWGWLMGSSEPLRRWLHRGAGVVLMVAGVYHVFYVIAKQPGRRLVRDLFPTWKDVADFTLAIRHLVGLSRQRPQFARFGYAEKMEYWAVVWGTIIMGVTGLVIWFKMDVTKFLPRWAVDVALTIHLYEAILACLAIVVWHFYHVIFDPDVYPLNMACWDGGVSEHWMHEEHPLDPASKTTSNESSGKSQPAEPTTETVSR